MKASEFDYHLPPDLIAQHPAELRDGARMMVLHRDRRQIEHRTFGDFTWYLRAGDLLVLNNTRVIPARIFGRKSESGGRVELLFLEELGPGIWDCLLHARRRPKTGDRVELAEGQARAVMLADGEMGRCRVRVEAEMPVLELLERHGEPPLPPYIQRVPGVPPSRGSSGVANGCRGEEDKERYQTVYAEKPGAVAAPTAGLHFTPDVLERARAAGAQTATVTLHVGLGTFRPVTAANIEDHVMEPERYEVPEETVGKIGDTKKRGGRVIAVGSTTVRTLETVAGNLPSLGKNLECASAACAIPGRSDASSAQGGSSASALQGRSALFIRPPYPFKVVDAMLTNFHLPKSTLLMMISSFAGLEFVREAYAEAIREKYRFYSYGDCMLIL